MLQNDMKLTRTDFSTHPKTGMTTTKLLLATLFTRLHVAYLVASTGAVTVFAFVVTAFVAHHTLFSTAPLEGLREQRMSRLTEPHQGSHCTRRSANHVGTTRQTIGTTVSALIATSKNHII